MRKFSVYTVHFGCTLQAPKQTARVNQMSHPTKRELFELCQRTASLGVMDVDSLACDNAAATLGDEFVKGQFTDEFVEHWFASVQVILASSDFVTETAREFFVRNNVAY